MLIEENKIIFVHIPKTGGQSITKFLMESYGQKFYLDDPKFWLIKNKKKQNPGPNTYHHLFLSEYLSLNIVNNLDEYRIFSVVRNPLTRFLSAFHFNKLHKKYSRYLDFLNSIHYIKDQNSDLYRHFCPQYKYISCYQDLTNQPTIFKFEDNLNQCIKSFVSKEIDSSIELEKINKTPKKHKNKLLSHAEIEKVFEIYEKDFRLFDYDFVAN